MVIREFKMSDYDDAYALWMSTSGVCNCDKCMVLNTPERIEKFLARNPGCCFVAVDNEKVMGTILAGHDSRTGLIYRLTVSEDRHRKGIGSALVESAVKALKKQGIPSVKIFVLKDNHRGNAFWENVGFKTFDRAIVREIEIN